MYLYPENLKARATLWCWSLSDVTLGGVFLAIGLVLLEAAGLVWPLAGAAAFLILTVRVQDSCVLDFLKAAARYFGRQKKYLL